MAETSLRTRAVITDNDGRLLLVQAPGAPWWHLPGGGVHPGEALHQAITRELQEELMVNARVGEVRAVWESLERSTETTYVSIWFDCDLTGPLPETWENHREIADARFFSPAELQKVDINPTEVKQFPELPRLITEEFDVFPWRD